MLSFDKSVTQTFIFDLNPPEANIIVIFLYHTNRIIDNKVIFIHNKPPNENFLSLFSHAGWRISRPNLEESWQN